MLSSNTACGHLDRRHRARGLCDNCYVKIRYAKLRALGYPSKMIRHPHSLAKHMEADRRYHHEHKKAQHVHNKTYRDKMIRLYGDRPDKSPEARIKWLLAKKAKGENDFSLHRV